MMILNRKIDTENMFPLLENGQPYSEMAMRVICDINPMAYFSYFPNKTVDGFDHTAMVTREMSIDYLYFRNGRIVEIFTTDIPENCFALTY